MCEAYFNQIIRSTIKDQYPTVMAAVALYSQSLFCRRAEIQSAGICCMSPPGGPVSAATRHFSTCQNWQWRLWDASRHSDRNITDKVNSLQAKSCKKHLVASQRCKKKKRLRCEATEYWWQINHDSIWRNPFCMHPKKNPTGTAMFYVRILQKRHQIFEPMEFKCMCVSKICWTFWRCSSTTISCNVYSLKVSNQHPIITWEWKMIHFSSRLRLKSHYCFHHVQLKVCY